MGIHLVMKNNFNRCMAHKVRYIIFFLLPIVVALIASLVNIQETKQYNVGVLCDNEEETDKLVSLLNKSEKLCISIANYEEQNADLLTGKYRFIIRLNDNKISIITMESSKKAEYYSNMIENIINSKSVTSNIKKTYSKEQQMMEMLLALFLVMTTINASSLIMDKQNQTINRFLFAPKRKLSYIMGNYFYNLLLTIIQLSVAVFIVKVISKELTLDFGKLFLLTTAIALISTTLGTIICLVSKSDVSANITAASIATVSSLIGGAFIPINTMPKIIQTLSAISPIRWIIELTKIFLVNTMG